MMGFQAIVSKKEKLRKERRLLLSLGSTNQLVSAVDLDSDHPWERVVQMVQLRVLEIVSGMASCPDLSRVGW